MRKLFLIPTMCLLCFTGMNHVNANESVRIDQSQDQTAPADWNITLHVKEALLTNSSLSLSNRLISVSVSTTDGVVTLTGTVESQDQLDEIIKTVKSVNGVVSVNNQLMIATS